MGQIILKYIKKCKFVSVCESVWIKFGVKIFQKLQRTRNLSAETFQIQMKALIQRSIFNMYLGVKIKSTRATRASADIFQFL